MILNSVGLYGHGKKGEKESRKGKKGKWISRTAQGKRGGNRFFQLLLEERRDLAEEGEEGSSSDPIGMGGKRGIRRISNPSEKRSRACRKKKKEKSHPSAHVHLQGKGRKKIACFARHLY